MNTFAWGDHLDTSSEWLDDRSHRGGPCPRCGSDQTLERNRAVYGRGFPVHRHTVLACLDCEMWSAICHASITEPQVFAWR